MRFIECPQGTPEWYASRCGLVTASMFSAACMEVGGLNDQQQTFIDSVLITAMSEKDAAALAGYKAVPRSAIIAAALRGEKTTDFSDEAKRYAADLAIERISGKPHGESIKTWVLERGHTMEAAARMIYEARTGAFVTEAGICVDDDGFGYSSDGLVDDDGLIEIKAPIDSSKILAMLKTGDTSEYDHQMQGGLWLTSRKWCDFIMYVPDLEPIGKDLYVKRIHRDEAFIDKMVQQLWAFQTLVKQCEQSFRETA